MTLVSVIQALEETRAFPGKTKSSNRRSTFSQRKAQTKPGRGAEDDKKDVFKGSLQNRSLPISILNVKNAFHETPPPTAQDGGCSLALL
jgi:hypothetical protein